MKNIDVKVVDGFGDEWSRFDQSELSDAELRQIFDNYFAIFPFDRLPPMSVGMDVGCGSGRWARVVAGRVGHLHCVDPAAGSVASAKRNLAGCPNVTVHQAGVDDLPAADNSLDFAYSLGVLHHIPNTLEAMRACVRKLKSGAPFLVYLYYKLDDRPVWFRRLWEVSEHLRARVSKMPHGPRYVASQIIAASVYWPLARLARLAERVGADVTNYPLTFYRDKSLYVMRTDALDRFGTSLEQRFSRSEIRQMMTECGLSEIRFSEGLPKWCAVGIKS